MGVAFPRLRFVRLLYGRRCPKANNARPAVSPKDEEDRVRKLKTGLAAIRARDHGRTAKELFIWWQWIAIFS